MSFKIKTRLIFKRMQTCLFLSIIYEYDDNNDRKITTTIVSHGILHAFLRRLLADYFRWKTIGILIKKCSTYLISIVDDDILVRGEVLLQFIGNVAVCQLRERAETRKWHHGLAPVEALCDNNGHYYYKHHANIQSKQR